MIAAFAALILAGDAYWVEWCIWNAIQHGDWNDATGLLVFVAATGLFAWFLFALGVGLWELSIDAWWVTVAFLGSSLALFAVATVDEAVHMSPDEDVQGALMGAVVILLITAAPLFYMFRVRRFFNGPLSMNALAVDRH